MNYALFTLSANLNPTISEKEEFILKRLRQTLAIVLAVVMLVATVPFVSNAADKAIKFSIAKVNDQPYDALVPIMRGDKIAIDVTVSRDASELLTGWQVCFNYDADALTYGGTQFPESWATWGNSAEADGYYKLWSLSPDPVALENEVVATIVFTASTTFSGTTNITTGMGLNYISIADSSGVSHSNYVTPVGCAIIIRTPVDKSALLAKVNEADALNAEDYTANSWSLFTPDYQYAKNIYNNPIATQTEVDTALANLTAAFDVLVLRGNLQPLQELVENALREIRLDKYTDESKQIVRDAIDAAEDVLGKEDNASKAEVEEQIAALTEALGKLQVNELTVKFLNYDGSTFDTQTVSYGGAAQAPATNPVKPSTDEYDYEFKGWVGDYTNVTENLEITPDFEAHKRSYTITFYEEDGETVITSITKEYGYELTSADAPEAPEKQQDDYNTYAFSGWSPELATVSADASYVAQYKPTAREYTIEFVNYDNSPLYSYTLGFGETVADPVTAGHIQAPIKPATDEKTFTFSGWSPAISAVSGNQVYTAQFSDKTNAYTVSFYNWDGTLLKEYSLDYGAAVINPITAGDIETPTRADDEMYSYTFKSWTPELAETVTATLSYTADYDRDPLPADYDAVDEQIDLANDLNENLYTPVSVARVRAAVNAVQRGYTIDKQDEVTAMATAIKNAINALVSTDKYDESWEKCAAVTNNDDGIYTPDSYSAFRAAMDAIGSKQNFNTEEATQADVNLAAKALDDAFNLLITATLEIDGEEEQIDSLSAIRVLSNTNSLTTKLYANDGGDGSTASLAFYDLNGNKVTNAKKSIGTGFKVELIQGGAVKSEKYIVIYGDIDGDGQVTISDIALARKIAVSESGYSEYAIAAAKCGGDTVDVSKIINLAKAI